MILITGGTGFLGSHLTTRLLESGESVRLLVRNKSQVPVEWPSLPGTLEIALGTVTEPESVAAAMAGVRQVVHLAAIGTPASPPAEAATLLAVNAGGTANVMVAAGEHEIERVVLASSAAVYGATTASPLEETMPVAPTSAYGVSKVAAEQLADVLGKQLGVSTIALRFFNIYGPGQESATQQAMLIPRLVHSAIEQVPFTITGDGSQARDFVHVSDCVDAILSSLKVQMVGATIVNVGTGQATSIKEVVEIVRRHSHHPPPITFSRSIGGGVAMSCADVTKTNRLLHFTPKVAMADGIHQLLSPTSPGP